MQIIKLGSRKEYLEKRLTTFNLESQKYKYEKITNGLSENAKVFLTILNFKIFKELEDEETYFLKLNYSDLVRVSKDIVVKNETIIREYFDFHVKDLNVIMVIEVWKKDQIDYLIGKVDFPLYDIETQDEYECEIGIPSDLDKDILVNQINLKIQFVKSFYQLHKDNSLKTEFEIAEISDSLEKIISLVEILNIPFDYFEELNYDPDYKKYNFQRRKPLLKLNEDKSQKTLTPSNSEFHKIIKKDKKIEIKEDSLITSLKIIIFSMIIMSNLLVRPDFVSPIIFFFLIWHQEILPKIKFRNKGYDLIVKCLISMIIYDLIWSVTNYSGFFGVQKFDLLLAQITFFIIFLNLLFKIAFLIIIILNRNKYQNDDKI